MAHVRIPPVTLEDLQAFQAKHFPATLNPLQSPSLPTHDVYNEDPYANTDEEDVEDEDDDLGYYPDGVKRTLTDEQIRIFRHSEIHALLRERQIKQENEEYERRLESEAESQDRLHVHGGPAENKDRGNEVISASASPKHDANAVTSRKRPAGEAESGSGAGKLASKKKSSFKSGAPSDVRLDYNEESADAPTTASQSRGGQAAPQFMGRRIISYDD